MSNAEDIIFLCKLYAWEVFMFFITMCMVKGKIVTYIVPVLLL